MHGLEFWEDSKGYWISCHCEADLEIGNVADLFSPAIMTECIIQSNNYQPH
jgi:hypothetical protein